MASAGAVKAGMAFIEISLDQTKLEKGLKAAQAKLKAFSSSISAAGRDLLMISGALGAPLAFATKTFADFDDRMRMVRAVTGATEGDFKSLTAQAKKLGRETSFTAGQVAEGMTSLGRMGFNPKEIESAVPAVLNLSRATGTELGAAAEIAANNMRVFGLESSKMTEVADIMTATANGSAQTLTDLGEGMKMAGSSAAIAKDNIVNVSGALGVLANMGVRGSMAGTALRKSYSQLAKLDIQKRLKKEFNIDTVDATGNLRDMPSMLTDIAKAMNSMPSAQKMNFANEIFDIRGATAANLLTGNIEQLDEFIKKLQNVQGAAGKTALEMDGGIGGAFRIFMSAVEGVQLALGEVVANAIIPLLNYLSPLLNKLAEWIETNKALVLIVVKTVAVVGALGIALVAIGIAAKLLAMALGGLALVFGILKVMILAPVIAVKILIASFAFLKAALLALKAVAIATWAVISAPAFMLAAALGVLVAVVWQLSGAWDMCATAAKGLGSSFVQAFAGMKEVVGETFEVIRAALASGDMAGAAKVGLAALKVMWLQGMLPLKQAWGKLKNFLSDSWTIVVYSVLKLANNLWYGLLMGLKHIGDGIANAWDFLWNGIIGSFEKTVGYLKKKWIQFKGFFDSDIKVEAEIARVDAEMAKNQKARSQRSADAKNRQAGERKALGKEWDSSNRAIDQAMAQEIGENGKAYADAMTGAAAEIASAKTAWQNAMDEVKKRAADKTAATAATTAKAAAATKGTKQAAEKLTSGKALGDFSVKALAGALGGGSAQERTAAATETTAKEAKDTNKHLKKIEKTPGAIAYGA